MSGKCLIPSLLVIATLLAACAPEAGNTIGNQPTETDTATLEISPPSHPADCPITVPQDPSFVPPPPYDKLGQEGEFWYGSNSLWTAVRRDGTWKGLPLSQGGYTQKVFWWREGYDREAEPEPVLMVTAERIDAKAPPGESSAATNASAGDIGTAMLVGLNLPTPGCWKITGNDGNSVLSFVVWVAP
jgi:hypothetical protein